MIKDKELKLFLDGTQELGENFNFTCWAGGNTSYKSNESLFIKASGFKLKKANSENIFVEVNYKKVIENLNNLSIDPLNKHTKKQNFKPSIETTMHALLPQKYFLLTLLKHFKPCYSKKFWKEIKLFNDLNYEIIKYAMPGISLANEIKIN